MRIDEPILRRCWFLAGPTACGKTEVGVLLAARLDAEIVSLDSMALYRGMDIGTAKPSPELRRRSVHHLVDILDPHEEFSVAEYVQRAEAVCRDVIQRGRIPLFVGGTGMYLRALLRGVFEGPPADWQFRHRLTRRAQQESPGWLHQQLQEVDPASARRLHPHDTKRLVRALEVFHLTGRPLSQQQLEKPLEPEKRPQHVYWLQPPRDWLHGRIEQRVDRMLAEGLIEECRRLQDRRPALSRTARQALGYKEVFAYLKGENTLPETVELIKRRTRQFAKRQYTWFRNLQECRAVPIDGTESAEELASRLLREAER